MTAASLARAVAAVFVALVLLVGCTSPPGGTGSSTSMDPAAAQDRKPRGNDLSGEGAPAPGRGGTSDRPNLLVITADDMRADELRWMPQVRARITAVGREYVNAFSPNPLCCPARASLLTGQLSHNHGVLSHEPPYGFHSFADDDTLATRLQGAGYRTALVGKYLNGYGVMAPPTGGNPLSYVPPGWTEWWGSLDNVGDRGGSYSYFNLRSNINGTEQSFPGRYTTEVTGEQTRALIDSFADGTAPWLVWWNPVAPHHGGPTEPDDPGSVARSDGFVVPWVTPARPERVKGRFDALIPTGSGVTSSGSAEADVADKPRYIRSYPQLLGQERQALLAVSRQRAEALSVLDDEIARTLDTLAATGEADRTLVVFTSDNGYYLGEHLKRQGKINLHEPSIRIPLVMAGAGIPAGETVAPATLVDVAVTLASAAGVTLDRPDGVDLLANPDSQEWARPVVLEGLMPELRYANARKRGTEMPVLNTSGVRLGRWKFVRYSTGEMELYDLQGDPLELDNLARDPRHAETRRQLRVLWERFAVCSEDTCREPVPPPFALDAATNRVITHAQKSATARHYGWLTMP